MNVHADRVHEPLLENRTWKTCTTEFEMAQEQLKQTLQSLHEELSTGAPVDPELRAQLQQLASEIERVLARTQSAQPPSGGDGTLLDRVAGIAAPFEETHPRLAAILGRIADGLSQLGI
jgi:hypothetical protein